MTERVAAPHPLRPPDHRRHDQRRHDQRAWNWPLVLIVICGAFAAAVTLTALSALQLTSRTAALPLLDRSVEALLQIDAYVEYAWPALEAAAASGMAIPLEGYPIALELDPDALDDGPAAVADAIRSTTVELVYADGLQVLSESPQTDRLLTELGLVDAAIDRLAADSRTAALIAVLISGAVSLLLAAAAASQSRGLGRYSAPAATLGIGALAVWLLGAIARSTFLGRASDTTDPFAAELWLVAADAVSLVVRNASAVSIACIAVVGAAVVGGFLLRLLDDSSRL